MSKSADNTPPAPSTLDEESDVIELTEEVQAKVASSDDSEELDSLALEMPEFKVPSADNGEPEEHKDEPQEATTQRLSAEALREANFADARSFVDDEVGEDSAEDGPQYDRQAMVKTIQMDAIDRSTLGELARNRESHDEDLLEDARFSPEIIARPPAVLVKKWREGLPGGVISIVGESPGVEAEQPSDEPATLPELPAEEPESEEEGESTEVVDVEEEVDPVEETEKSEDDQVDDESEIAVVDKSDEAIELELGSDAIEFDEELIELEEDNEPDPEPAEAPQKPSPPREPKEARPKSESKEGGDSEMKGLVKELLDERKEEKETKTKRLRPRDIWFQEVFTEEFLRTVPANIAELTDLEADFIAKSLKLKKKSRILDLACGYGRHSLELAERGYEMVGLDLSMPLLQRALAKAQERSLNVKFIHGDMRELNFSGVFDGCFIWDTSLGYFDDRMNLRVLQGVQRGLKTGGRILIDVINRDYVVRQTPTRMWWEGKGCIFLEESEFEYQTSTLHAKRSYIYEDGTPPLEQNSYVRLYNVHELRQMLHVAGFKVLEVSGERHHKGYFLGAASRRIIVLAEKRIKKKKRTETK